MLRLRCDHCGDEFSRDFNVAVHRRAPRHYCDVECHRRAMKRGGVADRSRRKTCRSRYGADYYITHPDVASEAGRRAHTPELEEQRWEKIRQGWAEDSQVLDRRRVSLTRSRVEVEFFQTLTSRLGVTFEEQCYRNGWFIDGRCLESNTYVQFDGEYWHSSPAARARDQEQDEWFREKGHTLVRVTDREWREDGEGVIARLAKVLCPGG